MTILLQLLACAPDTPRAIEDIEDFYRAVAEISCTQVIACEPESWLALDGQEVCEIQQLQRVRNTFGGGQTGYVDDLAKAEQCVDDMAVLTCMEQVVDGFMPPVCWEVRLWNGDVFPGETDGDERPPG